MRRLLVVDDEPIICDGIANMLEGEAQLDLEIYRAYSAKDALQKLDALRADIVLSDVKMPEMDGLALLEEIKKRWEFCRVIFLTGYENFQSLYQATRYPDVRYMLKSEGPKAVLEMVKTVLAELDRASWKKPDTPDFIKNSADIFKIGMIRSLLDGQFPFSKEQLDKEFPAVLDGIRIEEPFYLLLGNLMSRIPSSYFDFLNSFFLLRSLSEHYLNHFCRFIQVYYDPVTFIWILQGPEPESLVKRLPGVLELLQAGAEKELSLEISFLLERRPTTYSECPHDLAKLQQILGKTAGLRGKLLILDDISCEIDAELLTDFCEIKPGQLEMLAILLDQNNRESFFELFDRLTEKLSALKSRNNPYARECYLKLSELLLSHISKRQLTARISFRVATGPLTNSADHENLKDAVCYLRNVSEAIFDLQTEDADGELGLLFQRIDRYIDENLSGELSLSSISETVHFNPSYLSRVFKESFNFNLSEYIAEKRLAKAKELLLHTDLKIQDITERTGNYSPTNFCRFFKKAVGLTPQEYRKQKICQ